MIKVIYDSFVQVFESIEPVANLKALLDLFLFTPKSRNYGGGGGVGGGLVIKARMIRKRECHFGRDTFFFDLPYSRARVLVFNYIFISCI